MLPLLTEEVGIWLTLVLLRAVARGLQLLSPRERSHGQGGQQKCRTHENQQLLWLLDCLLRKFLDQIIKGVFSSLCLLSLASVRLPNWEIL